jgi:hypothetical protein
VFFAVVAFGDCQCRRWDFQCACSAGGHGQNEYRGHRRAGDIQDLAAAHVSVTEPGASFWRLYLLSLGFNCIPLSTTKCVAQNASLFPELFEIGLSSATARSS